MRGYAELMAIKDFRGGRGQAFGLDMSYDTNMCPWKTASESLVGQERTHIPTYPCPVSTYLKAGSTLSTW